MSDTLKMATILFAYKELQTGLLGIIDKFPGSKKEAVQYIGKQHQETLDFIDRAFSAKERKELSEFENMIQDDLSRMPTQLNEAIARFSMLISAAVIICPNPTRQFVDSMMEDADDGEINLFSSHPDFKP